MLSESSFFGGMFRQLEVKVVKESIQLSRYMNPAKVNTVAH